MGRHSDREFIGSLPEIYESHLVPLLFEHYAIDLAARAATRSPGRVLEIAAGTGVLTRALATWLPANASIVATDLNEPMLECARATGTARAVEWRQADVMKLPFSDGVFDLVVCQFGVMFFPDRLTAYAEVRRVLRPGGAFMFNVWDRIEDNEFADAVTEGVASVFPDDPPSFLRRTPHGYHERQAIERDLVKGGFVAGAQMVTVTATSRAGSARIPAVGFCQGTPLRNEIMERDASRLDEATQAAEQEVARRFGDGEIVGKMRAHVVIAEG